MKLYRFLLGSIVLLAISNSALACSPPTPLSLGPKAPQIPYERPSYFAFLGKVVGHTTTSSGHPALSLLVLDAWTDRQVGGQVITIGVAQWRGCNLPKPMGAPFRPKDYPVGTRLRVIAQEKTMYTWDVDAGILVLGRGT